MVEWSHKLSCNVNDILDIGNRHVAYRLRDAVAGGDVERIYVHALRQFDDPALLRRLYDFPGRLGGQDRTGTVVRKFYHIAQSQRRVVIQQRGNPLDGRAKIAPPSF
jgi:hypothetical protein